MKRFTILLLILLAGIHAGFGQAMTRRERVQEKKRIRAACEHAWMGYKTYAWGYDALKPVSCTGHNWYSASLLMTPVDAFDTFILLGMKREAKEAEQLIVERLSFDADLEVQVFEVNIRLVGGLLSAYEITKNPRFLELAEDLGRRLLPAFGSATGIPYRYVNLKTGKTRDAKSNPAEAGTCLLEFGKLSQLTGDPQFYIVAKKAVTEVFRRRSDLDLVGTVIDVNTGEWINHECQIGARVDSYFEYLYKAWLLFGDQECLEMWQTHHRAIMKHMIAKEQGGWYFTRVDMRSGKETAPLYGALDAFYAGILALSGDTASAAMVQRANHEMWTTFGMEPEEFNFRSKEITDPGYALRPENLESCFYLYRITGDDRYRVQAAGMISDILENCRTDAGYAAIRDVRTMEKTDSMESFFFAETLKYAWLLFAPESRWSDLKKVVFNTEAHPLNRGTMPGEQPGGE